MLCTLCLLRISDDSILMIAMQAFLQKLGATQASIRGFKLPVDLVFYVCMALPLLELFATHIESFLLWDTAGGKSVCRKYLSAIMALEWHIPFLANP